MCVCVWACLCVWCIFVCVVYMMCVWYVGVCECVCVVCKCTQMFSHKQNLLPPTERSTGQHIKKQEPCRVVSCAAAPSVLLQVTLPDSINSKLTLRPHT